MAAGLIVRNITTADGVTVPTLMWADETSAPTQVTPVHLLLSDAGVPVDPASLATETTLASLLALVESPAPIAVSSTQLNAFIPVDSEVVAFTDVSANSSALAAGRVRVVARGANARIRVGETPLTAIATDMLIFEDQPEYVQVGDNWVISVIREASTSGSLEIATEAEIPTP